MVKSTSSTSATVITTSGTLSNSSDQHSSWQRFQSNESSALEQLSKTNVERLKYLDRFPIFVFPPFLCFNLNESSSFRKDIKLINPYAWRINYRVFTTVQQRYEVSPFEGSLGANRTSHISIRLLDTSLRNLGPSDVLRIRVVADDNTGMGSKDLPVHFSTDEAILEKYRLTQVDEHNDSLEEFIKSSSPQQSRDFVKMITNKQPSTFKSDTQGAASSTSSSGQNKPKSESNNWPPSFYVIVAIFCGIILCLPSENESKLPTFMSVSTTPKFVAAYVLGILTSLICKFY